MSTAQVDSVESYKMFTWAVLLNLLKTPIWVSIEDRDQVGDASYHPDDYAYVPPGLACPGAAILDHLVEGYQLASPAVPANEPK